MFLYVFLVAVMFRLPSPVPLPPPDTTGGMSLSQALDERRSVRSFSETDSLTLQQLAQLLWAAQGKTGARGGRTAPSAGATYPLEALCVVDRVSGLEPGLYRYSPVEHHLVPLFHSEGLARELAAACLGQSWMARASATLILSAIYSRTTDHYGIRGTRYVDMEAGHAGQNIYLQAVALGLGTCAVGAFREADVARLLRLDGVEPLYIFPVGVRE
jgi:SagB-type dehydrogenase family enzyme